MADMDPHNPMIEKPEPVKLCKDCKHYSADESLYRAPFWPWQKPTISLAAMKYAKCSHHEAVRNEYNLVAGPETGEPEYCSVMRSEYSKECGPEGKLWETR